MINWVAVAAVTFPTAPLLKTTVLLAGVVALKPMPRMVRVVTTLGILALLKVTVGAATIVAT